MKSKEKKFAKIDDFPNLIDWFERVYVGKPIEIDFNSEKGIYRGTIVYYRKNNIKHLIEMDKYKNFVQINEK